VQQIGLDQRLSNMDAERTGRAGDPVNVVWVGPPDRGESRAAGAADVTELFRAHQLELVRLALLMGVDLGTAEDVVQDAFERLHHRWGKLRNPGSGLAYARSTVLNGCRTVHRRSAVARRHAPRLAEPAPGPGSGGPADYADRSEMAAALRAIPRRQREVLVLRYYADLDVAEIAQTLGIGQAAVRSHASRGLAALARVLGEG
jgi:RNA polymerase sigma-70 factor (sigma-E family)